MNFFRTPQFCLGISLFILVGCRTRPKLDQNYQAKDFKISGKPTVYTTTTEKDSDKNTTRNSYWKDSIDFTPIQTESEDWELVTPTPVEPRDIPIDEAEGHQWPTVYFAFNQSFIEETEREKLEKLANYLIENPDLVVIIEGHCDERGSEEYNRALGERRAIAIRDYLARLGVGDSGMQTISYGEERPVDFSQTESGHSRNRRAEFIVGIPK